MRAAPQPAAARHTHPIPPGQSPAVRTGVSTMKKAHTPTPVPAETRPLPSPEGDVGPAWRRVVGRRSFLKDMGLAAAALPAGAALANGGTQTGNKLNKGDVAILRFLAAAELIESDLWQQYNELGGVAGGNPAYI